MASLITSYRRIARPDCTTVSSRKGHRRFTVSRLRTEVPDSQDEESSPYCTHRNVPFINGISLKQVVSTITGTHGNRGSIYAIVLAKMLSYRPQYRRLNGS
jgi:hypothetical protein